MVKKEKNYGLNFEARHENRSNSREGVSEILTIFYTEIHGSFLKIFSSLHTRIQL